MSVEVLGGIVGIVLSLALAYVPRLSDWYATKDARQKAQIMAGLLVATALGVFGLGWANLYVLVACSVAGARELVGVLIAALVANQAAFTLLVKPFKS